MASVSPAGFGAFSFACFVVLSVAVLRRPAGAATMCGLQGLKERDQPTPLVGAQPEARLDVGGERRAVSHTARIVVQRLAERVKAAIVHIGCCVCDCAQRRRLEAQRRGGSNRLIRAREPNVVQTPRARPR